MRYSKLISIINISYVMFLLTPSLILLLFLSALDSADAADGVKPSQSNTLEVSTILDEVQREFESGDLSAALNLLSGILSRDQSNAEAHAKIGVILVRKGRFNEGLEHLKQAIIISPQNIKFRKSLAYSYEFRMDYDNAIKNYRLISELVPRSSAAYKEAIKKVSFLTATKQARSGDIESALPVFTRLSQEYPDDFLIRYSLGLGYFFLKKMDEAKLEFEKVIELNPRYVNAYLNLASIHETRGEIALAVENLEEVIVRDTESQIGKRARVRLGLIEANLIAASGNHQDALDILGDVIDLNPQSIPALMLMARSLSSLGRIELAKEKYLKVVVLVPGHLEAKIQLAGLYSMTKKMGHAIDLFEEIVVEGAGTKYAIEAKKALINISGKGESGGDLFGSMSPAEKTEVIKEFLLDRIRTNPKGAEAYFRLAQFYMQKKRKEEAYQYILNAVKYDPRNLKFIGIKAALADDLQKYDDAMSAYATATMLETDPEKAAATSVFLRMVTAKKLFSDGNLGEAEQAFKSIIADQPDNVTPYFYLGSIYSREESFLKAVDSYENVIRISPGNLGARLNLAGTLERLNQEEDAISEYRKILQDNPSKEFADNVKARLFATENKIKGMTVSIGYSIGYDDSAVADDTITSAGAEIRSDMSFNLSYQYKMENGLRLRFTSSPRYSTYHEGQFDFLNISNSVSAMITSGRYTIVGGLTSRASQGLLTERRSSSTDLIFAEFMTRTKFRKIYDFWSEEKIITGFTFSFSQTNFDSRTNSTFSSESYRLGVDINQRFDDRSTITLGYSYLINNNIEASASDYAYQNHGLKLGFNRRLPNAISVNMSYGYSLQDYDNLDSFTEFKAYRRQNSHNISTGMNYWLNRKIRFYANYTFVKIISNLGIDVRTQSTSLAGSGRNSITVGVNILL
ncbi:MAG: tetratricopeptide repeat protein [Thiotrichaceae bacterium]|nr:tetratricopeptide repeat protein [Thiotrichaceae bacterium]